ncbi:MAG: hypothetical protein R6X09_04235, partial [Bacteroidales bacterium]
AVVISPHQAGHAATVPFGRQDPGQSEEDLLAVADDAEVRLRHLMNTKRRTTSPYSKQADGMRF